MPCTTAKNTAQKASVGKGKTMVKASEPSSFWTEELDVEGVGLLCGALARIETHKIPAGTIRIDWHLG